MQKFHISTAILNGTCFLCENSCLFWKLSAVKLNSKLTNYLNENGMLRTLTK